MEAITLIDKSEKIKFSIEFSGVVHLQIFSMRGDLINEINHHDIEQGDNFLDASHIHPKH